MEELYFIICSILIGGWGAGGLKVTSWEPQEYNLYTIVSLSCSADVFLNDCLVQGSKCCRSLAFRCTNTVCYIERIIEDTENTSYIFVLLGASFFSWWPGRIEGAVDQDDVLPHLGLRTGWKIWGFSNISPND